MELECSDGPWEEDILSHLAPDPSAAPGQIPEAESLRVGGHLTQPHVHCPSSLLFSVTLAHDIAEPLTWILHSASTLATSSNSSSCTGVPSHPTPSIPQFKYHFL